MDLTIPFLDLDVPLSVVIFGCVKGMTYSLIAVGLTLVYRSTRALNFAAGEMGALPALLIPWLVLTQGWPYWVALPLALATAASIGALSEVLVMRPLAKAPRLTVLVATIGLSQVLFALGVLLPNAGEMTGQRYPVPFSAQLSLGSVTLTSGQLLILVCAPLTVIALSAYLRYSTTGRASRAAAENPEAARLAGIPIQRVALAIWVIAGLLAGIAAVLAGPTRPLVLSQALGPDLLLRALGAAMIGGLVSIWGSFGGGIVVGVLEALVIWNYPTSGVLDLAIAAVIVISLLARRNLGGALRGRSGTGWTFANTVRPLAPDLARHRSVRLLRIGSFGALAAVAILIPMALRVSTLFLLSNVVLFALMGLSIVILTGYAGHVSLGQFAFVAIGAAVGGRLTAAGVGFVPALAITILIGCSVAILVGLPSLRVRGLFLATTTLAFAVVTVGWLFRQPWFVVTRSGGGSSLRIDRPTIFGVDFDGELAYYWMCLGALVIGIVIVATIRRTGLGRMLIAVRDNEPSAAALGLSPRRVKLTAFLIAGGMATAAGFLFGGLMINFSNDPRSTFSASQSLSLVVTTVFGGVTTVTGAVLGAVWIEGIPRLLGSGYALLTSGFALIVVLVLLPGGLATVVFSVRDHLVAWLVRGTAPPEHDPAEDRPTTSEPGETPELAGLASTALRIRHLPSPSPPPAGDHASGDQGVPPARVLAADAVTVRFGGLAALHDVSVHVVQDEILGLMGPNGAGKTTLFDVLSGTIRPTAGRVRLGDQDITRLAPHTRARLGIGRTYQQAQLFGDLTLLECVCVSLEQRIPSRAAAVVVGWPGTFKANREQVARAGEIIDLLGLGSYAGRPASQLPTGVRRLAELACVIGLGASVLLLDEPAAGLTGREIEEFGHVIRGVRDHLGATVIVIDHDVHMMAQLVDRLYVLDSGQLIAQGPVSLLQTDSRVIEAYLGTAHGARKDASGPLR